MEEARLVERARSGDDTAYEELVRAHQEAAFRTACLITGDAADAEDAAQEAFVKAYRALHRFKAGSPFRPWLLSIVANESRNRRKAASRRAGLALRASAEVSARSPAGLLQEDASPEAAVVAGERRAELLGALGELGETDRLVIACRYFLGLSEEETAAAAGCARGTVKSRLSRAIGRLRKRLQEGEDAE